MQVHRVVKAWKVMGSEVDFGLDMELDDEPADGEAKSFHPTDALLMVVMEDSTQPMMMNQW